MFGKLFRSVKRAVSSVTKNPLKAVSTAAIGTVSMQWATDAALKKVIGEKAFAKYTPKQIAPALNVLHAVGALTPGDVGKMAKGDVSKLNAITGKAVNVLAANAEAGALYQGVTPALGSQAQLIMSEVDKLRRENTPAARKIVAEFDKRVAAKRTLRAKELNRIVRGYYSKDKGEQAATRKKVAELAKKAEQGDAIAAHEYTLLRKRKAGLAKARTFKVDRSGMVRRAA